MVKVVRFGVSFDEKLLEYFDSYAKGKGYKNRSKALRDLAREKLHSEARKQASGIIHVLFDQRRERGKESVSSIENAHNCLVNMITRRYVDRHLCSDTLHFSGDAKRIKKLSSSLRACPSLKKLTVEFF